MSSSPTVLAHARSPASTLAGVGADAAAAAAAAPAASMPSPQERLTQRLSSVTASKLVGGMQQVTHEVMTKGAILITRHEVPTMVMLSVERYLALERAAEPDLGSLTRQFDDMLARMQTADSVRGMAQAFAMTPAQLGRAAAAAADGAATNAPKAAQPVKSGKTGKAR